VRSVLEAMSKGADGVEVDVRLTLDGVLVCSHDDRVTTPLGRPLLVSRTTASELLACAGTGSQDRLATLAEVLTILEAAAGHVVVEAKPADDHVGAFRTARALAGLLLPLSTSTSITVSSFDPRVLDAVRRLVFGTSVRTALLADGSQSAVAALRQVDEAGYDEAHLSVEALRQAPHAVRMAAHRGIDITAWTVNGADLGHVAALGVDGLITDDIPAARAALRRGTLPSVPAPAAETAC
jgi:glycerophosphoryl diester phosphodiesterase